MKKLMIVAAAAAMAGSVFADAQVYDVQAVAVKTVAARGTIAANTNPFRTAAGVINYRTPATATYGGTIWGCDCDGFYGNYNVTTNANDKRIRYDGMVLWNQNADVVKMTSPDDPWGLQVAFVQAIGAYGQELEAFFGLNFPAITNVCGTVANTWIDAAGFGRNIIVGTNNCANAVAYLQGYFVGMVAAPTVNQAGETICYYCGDTVTPGTCQLTGVWDWCTCYGDMMPAESAIYGQWAIVYNAGYSVLLKNSADIVDIYPFPTKVATKVAALHAKRYAD